MSVPPEGLVFLELAGGQTVGLGGPGGPVAAFESEANAVEFANLKGVRGYRLDRIRGRELIDRLERLAYQQRVLLAVDPITGLTFRIPDIVPRPAFVSVIISFPESDFALARETGYTQFGTYAAYQAAVEAQVQRVKEQGGRASVQLLPVAEMLAQMESRGLPNTSEGRAKLCSLIGTAAFRQG